jgi:glycosyltransferase involved in cell wall biosynthesis
MIATTTYRMYPGNRMIANSQFVADMIYKIRKEKIKVVNPGIDHSVFYPRKRKENSGDKRILTMARLEKWKGLDDFIIAAKKLQAELAVETTLVSKQPGIAAIAKEAGMKFVFNPSDEELAQLYSSCDVFVHSSYYEGFGLPPLEAMACGAAVVMTDSLGVRDYAVNEMNCLMVPAQNPMKLKQTIERCLAEDDLVQSLRANGLTTSANFDVDKAALTHLRIIEDAINH